MSDDSDSGDGLNRRTFVNALGAATGGAALGGLASVSVSASGGATDEQVERALSSDRVRTIFEEVGRLPVERDGAEHVEITDRGRRYEATRLPTPVGQLTYVEDGEGTTEAMLRIGETDGVGSLSREARRHLPEGFHSLPADAGAVYLAGEGGDALFRSPTSDELAALGDALDVDPDEAYAYTYDQEPGFKVLVPGSGDEIDAYTVVPDGGTVAADEVAYQEVSPDRLADGEVTEEDWGLTKCASICLTCVTAAATCIRCAIPCAGSVSGIGAIACAICLVASCSAGAGGCYLCYDNCKHHVRSPGRAAAARRRGRRGR
jgi:hypothetical protein